MVFEHDVPMKNVFSAMRFLPPIYAFSYAEDIYKLRSIIKNQTL